MNIENLIGLHEEYQTYLEIVKEERKSKRKKISDLEKLKKLNDDNGLDTSIIDEKVIELRLDYEESTEEIKKLKKVIYRLNICQKILLGEEVDTLENAEEIEDIEDMEV